MNKRKVIKILIAVILLIITAGAIGYFYYEPEKPWLAFFIACSAGALIVNIILSIVFIYKNFKGKGRA